LFDWKATPPPGGPKPVRIVGQSNGTSYAVAHTAGVAVLWLAKHGHPALVARYGRRNVQAAFVAVLRRPGVCKQTPGWDPDEYGVGVVDAEAVLREPLPEPAAVTGRRALAAGASDDTIDRLAAQTATTREQVADAIDALFGVGASDDPAFLRRFEGELVYLAFADAGFRELLGSPRRARGAPAAPPIAAASPQLRARLG
jgi:hypothetical protein